MELSPEAKEARRKYMREYMRKWRKENRDKVKQYEIRKWENKAKKLNNLG